MSSPRHSAEELRDWWVKRAASDIDSVMSKVVEYGAGDLELIGNELARISGSTWEAHNIELGIVFYILGKISRATSAIAAGHLPSDDTIKDIKVYAGMLDYAREFGSWGVTDGTRRNVSPESAPSLFADGVSSHTVGGTGRLGAT